MEIEFLKNRILQIHAVWGCSVDIFKYGFPIQKRELSTINNNYDENYFCYERYIKYLDVLATRYDDAFELMYFYSSTFWPGQFYDKERYKEQLLDYIACDVYEITF